MRLSALYSVSEFLSKLLLFAERLFGPKPVLIE